MHDWNLTDWQCVFEVKRPKFRRVTATECYRFYARQHTARSAKRVLGLAIVIMSDRLSVCPSRPGTDSSPGDNRDSGFLPHDSLSSLVSCEQISCRWVRRFPWNDCIKEGYPLRNRYFTAISSSSMRTVADRHRLSAHHNKHCWRAFRGGANIDDLEGPWTPKIVFLVNFSRFEAATHILRLNCAKSTGDRSRQHEIFSIKRRS